MLIGNTTLFMADRPQLYAVGAPETPPSTRVWLCEESGEQSVHVRNTKSSALTPRKPSHPYTAFCGQLMPLGFQLTFVLAAQRSDRANNL